MSNGAEWISASERTPVPLQDVIVAAACDEDQSGYIVDIGFYTRKKQRWQITGYSSIYIDVRYWQPLPQPPKRKEAKNP